MSMIAEISLFSWIIFGIAFLLIIGLGLLIALRMKNPHSKRKEHEQARLDKKRGIASPLTTSDVESKTRFERYTERLKTWKKVFLNLGIVIVGIFLWYMVPTTGIHPADVSSWSKEHWLQVLIVYGIVASLIWLNADEKSAKVLQKVLVGGVFILLFVLPSWFWISSPSSTAQSNSSRFETPLTSLPKSDWPKMAIPAGRSAHISVPPYMHADVIGDGVTLENVYQNGQVCAFGKPCADGPLKFIRATNGTGREIVISYAFVPI